MSSFFDFSIWNEKVDTDRVVVEEKVRVKLVLRRTLWRINRRSALSHDVISRVRAVHFT